MTTKIEQGFVSGFGGVSVEGIPEAVGHLKTVLQ